MTEATDVLQDDKRIITDVAFGVNPVLLGKKLATPVQRGMAMMVDAFFVLLLTDVSGVFWGLFAGIAFLHAGKKRENKRWRLTRYCLRVLGAIVIFISVVTMYGDLTGSVDSNDTNSFVPVVDSDGSVVSHEAVIDQDLTLNQLIGVGSLVNDVVNLKEDLMARDECLRDCYHPRMLKFVESLVHSGIGQAEGLSMIEDVLPDNVFENQELKSDYLSELQSHYVDLTGIDKKLSEDPITEVSESNDKQTELENLNSTSDKKVEPLEDKPVYSMMEYVKALISDLGLGFGWAALYFTAFSAWWKGQTPGKKLMKIRVIQLDGTYMSAWDSFGRYGGYGAGFATGLMGFLQIYWDANRQAIQDKISATVVIQGDIK